MTNDERSFEGSSDRPVILVPLWRYHERLAAGETIRLRLGVRGERYQLTVRRLQAEAGLAESVERPLCQAAPGVRPQVHQAGLLHRWVFAQDEVWVDVHGCEHVIALMPQRYVEHVIGYLRANAWRLSIVLLDPREASPEMILSAPEWVETLPIMAALRRRLEEGEARG